MKRIHLYLLALALSLVGGSVIYYKWKVLDFPLHPHTEVEVWTVQAKVEYQPRRAANTVVLQVPASTPGFAILDERFVARNYSRLEDSRRDGREVQWSIRRATGRQALYYRATVVRTKQEMEVEAAPRIGTPPTLEEPYATAAQTLLDQVRDGSSSIATYAKELVRRVNLDAPSEEVALLMESYGDPEARARYIAQLLAMRSIPARIVRGLELGETQSTAELRPWLQVHNGTDWITINLRTAADGWPDNLLLWSGSEQALLQIEDAMRPVVTFSVSRNLADAIAIAERRLEVQNANLVRYSLLSLPLQTQSVYKVLLMVPIGAFMMLLLRNLVGVKTFGTFMPVLIAIAFRETQLVAGIILFVLVVGSGLLVRFYMEQLRLLLVPRLTSVLILVVLLMAAVSVIANQLGIEVGLSVALFPMVIMAMAIERMSIAWEERGAGHALREGIGTLIVACAAYLLMSWPALEHFVFVFPEFLLILLAATLLLGRYSGYRLSELFRFRALAREVDEKERARAAGAGTETKA
ncbi:MAG: inactive transglutaminase family protein [Aquimonas sp.]|nr:inactive transglutaminase family protein [Aquimonas sp.]